MRQVLFHIPLDRPWFLGPFGHVTMFGPTGILFWIWVAFGVWHFLTSLRSDSESRRSRSTDSGRERLTSTKNSKNIDQPDAKNGIGFTWIIGAIAFALAPQLGAYLRANGAAHFQQGLPVFGYGFMLFLGITCAIGIANWRAAKEHLPTDLIWDLAFCLIAGGIAGGRLFFLVQKHSEVFANVASVPQFLNAVFNLSQGGLVLYGALLAGAVTYFSFCYVRQISARSLLDIVTTAIFIGIGFGRIGCFLNGCCYGDESSLPWAVCFPPGSAAFESLAWKGLIPHDATCTPALHPTQLYSAFDGFVIAAITFWYYRHRRRSGDCLAIALVIYPITRFVIEVLRNDEGGQLGTSLTIAQWISVGIFATNLVYIVWLSRQPAGIIPLTTSTNRDRSMPSLPPMAKTQPVAQ